MSGGTAAARRSGKSLLELLVVVAIVGTVLSLLLAAVQRIRETAARMVSTNNVKQMCLAVHDFAAVHQDQLPNAYHNPSPFAWGSGNVFVAILLYLEIDQKALLAEGLASPTNRPSFVSTFVSPADFTLNIREYTGPISYVANFQVFKGKPSFAHTFRDGTSNTLMFAEHYSNCWHISMYYSGIVNGAPFFAGGPNGWYPVTRGDPPVTLSNMAFIYPDETFQVAPPYQQCHVQVPQTPHRSGMIVGLCDGSVRTMRGDVGPHIFWGATTPASGEILSPADF